MGWRRTVGEFGAEVGNGSAAGRGASPFLHEEDHQPGRQADGGCEEKGDERDKDKVHRTRVMGEPAARLRDEEDDEANEEHDGEEKRVAIHPAGLLLLAVVVVRLIHNDMLARGEE